MLVVLRCAGDYDERAHPKEGGAEFDLPGLPGKRFDYLAIDPDGHYLISAHLAAKRAYDVIDLARNKVVPAVTDTTGAEGVEYVPDLHKFYTSSAYDNTIGVLDPSRRVHAGSVPVVERRRQLRQFSLFG